MSPRRHKLGHKQFDVIREELLTSTATQQDIATKHQVSIVNNSRTYGNYLAGKKAKQSLRAPVTVAQPTKYEKAQQAGLKPLSVEARIEKRFAEELEKLNEKYAPYSDVWTNIERLDERVDTVHTNAKQRSADALSIAARAHHTARLAFMVSIASLVLSIIAIVK